MADAINGTPLSIFPLAFPPSLVRPSLVLPSLGIPSLVLPYLFLGGFRRFQPSFAMANETNVTYLFINFHSSPFHIAFFGVFVGFSLP